VRAHTPDALAIIVKSTSVQLQDSPLFNKEGDGGDSGEASPGASPNKSQELCLSLKGATDNNNGKPLRGYSIMMPAEIEKIKEIIVNEYHPEKIILFGSYARGDQTADSDIDLLVLSDREKNIPRTRRGLSVLKKLGVIHRAIDIMFYTSEEFQKYQSVPQSINATILREGVVIHGK